MFIDGIWQILDIYIDDGIQSEQFKIPSSVQIVLSPAPWNISVFYVFRGYRKGALARNGLK